MMMQTNKPTTIAVVGAGIIGLCAAIRVQSLGHKVVLIDQAQPGKGASFGNAGFCATESLDPLATQANIFRAPLDLANPNSFLFLRWQDLWGNLPWLRQFFCQADHQAVVRNRQVLTWLNTRALPAWQDLLTQLNLTQEISLSGYLLTFEKSSETSARKVLSQMQANNIVAEWLSDKAIRTLEPNLSPRIHHGVRWPHAARFQDPYALCQKIHQRFLVQGGLFVKTRVLRLEQKEQGTLLHCADGNTRQFFKAVIAAGVHSDTLLQNTGMTVPLIAERGYHVTFPDQMDLLSHTVGSADRRVVISPLSCGLRVVGISELARPGSPAGIRPPQVLRKQVSALLPSLTQSAVASGTSWMGERPTLPDSLPVIDCHPKDPRLIFAFGHQHLGVTQAAITSEIVGELLCGRQNPEIGHRVSLRRF